MNTVSRWIHGVTGTEWNQMAGLYIVMPHSRHLEYSFVSCYFKQQAPSRFTSELSQFPRSTLLPYGKHLLGLRDVDSLSDEEILELQTNAPRIQQKSWKSSFWRFHGYIIHLEYMRLVPSFVRIMFTRNYVIRLAHSTFNVQRWSHKAP